MEALFVWPEEDTDTIAVSQQHDWDAGPCALQNAFKALGLQILDPEKIISCFPLVPSPPTASVRPIREYLEFRMNEGHTPQEMIAAAEKASGGRVLGLFFPFHYRTRVDIFRFLREFLEKGAVAIATGNMEKLSRFADYIHHQMIYGIEEDEIHVTNPIDSYSIDTFIAFVTAEPQICISKKDLLEQTLEAASPVALREALSDSAFTRPPFSTYRVREQLEEVFQLHTIANVNGKHSSLGEDSEFAEHSPSLTPLGHVTLPWRGQCGLTIFAVRGTDAERILKQFSGKKLPEYNSLEELVRDRFHRQHSHSLRREVEVLEVLRAVIEKRKLEASAMPNALSSRTPGRAGGMPAISTAVDENSREFWSGVLEEMEAWPDMLEEARANVDVDSFMGALEPVIAAAATKLAQRFAADSGWLRRVIDHRVRFVLQYTFDDEPTTSAEDSSSDSPSPSPPSTPSGVMSPSSRRRRNMSSNSSGSLANGTNARRRNDELAKKVLTKVIQETMLSLINKAARVNPAGRAPMPADLASAYTIEIASGSWFTPAHKDVKERAYPYPAPDADLSITFEARRHALSAADSMDDELVGYIIVSENFIFDLCVDPNYCYQGIATRLVQRVCEDLVRSERRSMQGTLAAAMRIDTEVRATNQPAKRFLEKLGFEVSARVFPLQHDWHGGYRMTAPIQRVLEKCRAITGVQSIALPQTNIASKARMPR